MSTATPADNTSEPAEDAQPASEAVNGGNGNNTARTSLIVGGIIALTAVLLVAAGFVFGWFEQPKYPTRTAPA